MRIGELAQQAQVNIQTLRFYERESLLRAPLRSASGYRRYEASDLDRVRFIRNCQGLGFTLREIKQLIQLHSGASTARGAALRPTAVREIIDLANERLSVIDEKIQALNSMRNELIELVETLSSTSPAVCPASRKNSDKQKSKIDA